MLLDQTRECDEEELTCCKAISKECASTRASIAKLAKRLDSFLSRKANVKFSSFVNPPSPQPLSTSEERYFVEVVNPLNGTLENRFCIVDRASGVRRLELSHKFVGGERTRMALHASSDMHSVGWGTLQWLFTKEQLVGTFTYGRFHAVTNCRTQALTQSGLMFMRLDWSVYLSCRRGPFKACANNYLMREAGQEIGNTQNCSNIVFRFLAPRFARDLDYRGGDVGSEQWYKGLWTQVVRRLQSSDIGVEDKKGRWWATESSTRLASSMCTITLFVLLWLGFKRKLWHSLDKSPSHLLL